MRTLASNLMIYEAHEARPFRAIAAEDPPLAGRSNLQASEPGELEEADEPEDPAELDEPEDPGAPGELDEPPPPEDTPMAALIRPGPVSGPWGRSTFTRRRRQPE
jgi:hypothetical protein